MTRFLISKETWLKSVNSIFMEESTFNMKDVDLIPIMQNNITNLELVYTSIYNFQSITTMKSLRLLKIFTADSLNFYKVTNLDELYLHSTHSAEIFYRGTESLYGLRGLTLVKPFFSYTYSAVMVNCLEMGKFTNLTSLAICGHFVNNAENISVLKGLRLLDMSRSTVEKERVLEDWIGLTNLTSLSVGFTKPSIVSDSTLYLLKNFVGLRELSIVKSKVLNSLDNLLALMNLEKINLCNCKYVNEILEVIAKHKNVKRVLLSKAVDNVTLKDEWGFEVIWIKESKISF